MAALLCDGAYFMHASMDRGIYDRVSESQDKNEQIE